MSFNNGFNNGLTTVLITITRVSLIICVDS